jgi:1-pyrroline-5-carboxylate dehydrogenase
LKAALVEMRSQCPDIPIVINGEEIRTGKVEKQLIGCDHKKSLCTYHEADTALLDKVNVDFGNF